MANKINIAVIVDQTGITAMDKAIFLNQIQSAAFIIDQALFGNLTDQSTSFIKFPNLHLASYSRGPVGIKCMNARRDITIDIEVIGFAVDFNPISLAIIDSIVIGGTIPESGTLIGGSPSTFRLTGFIKSKGDCGSRIIRLTHNSFLSTMIEVMPIIVNLHPTADKLANLSVAPCRNGFVIEQAVVLHLTGANAVLAEVVVVTVNELNAGERNAVNVIGIADPACVCNAVGISLTVGVYAVEELAASAFQNAVHNRVGVTGCFYFRTPINGRVTGIAPGSAGIAVLGAGCCKIRHGNRAVYVITVSIIEIFVVIAKIYAVGIRNTKSMDIFAGEAMAAAIKVGDHTHFGINVNRESRCANIVTLPCFYCIGMNVVVTGNVIPYTDGKTCHGFRTLSGEITITRQSYGHDVFRFIICRCKFPLAIKTAENGHLIQFPIVHAVKIKLHLNRLNALNGIDLNVDPIDGAVKHINEILILRLNTDRSIVIFGFYRDLTLCFGIVAHLVRNTDTDRMDAVGKSCTGNGNQTVRIFAINLETVNIRYGRRCIKTGSVVGIRHIFCNIDCKINDIFVDSLTIESSCITHSLYCIGHITENGILTIVNRIGIVNGNVVDVECEITCVIGLILFPGFNVYCVKFKEAVRLPLKL